MLQKNICFTFSTLHIDSLQLKLMTDCRQTQLYSQSLKFSTKSKTESETFPDWPGPVNPVLSVHSCI